MKTTNIVIKPSTAAGGASLFQSVNPRPIIAYCLEDTNHLVSLENRQSRTISTSNV